MYSKGSVNKMILVGNLGRTPELKSTEKGHSVLTLSLATNRDFKNAQGEDQKETTWHRATVWGKQAESCARYLTKGSRVYVEGELRIRTYEDKDGVKRRSPEINVDVVTFLGGGQPSGTAEGVNAPAETGAVALAM